MGKISVVSAFPKGADGGYQVALWDKDSRHEGGELLIADDKVHSVEATPGVMQAIANGSLFESTKSGVPKDEENKSLLEEREAEAKANAPTSGAPDTKSKNK